MKRSMDSEDEGALEEAKKVKFPSVGPSPFKPIPALDLHLKSNKEVYSNSTDFDHIEQESRKLNLDMKNRKMDKIDQLIEMAEKEAELTEFPPLLTLGKELVRYQRRTAKAYMQNIKSEDYLDPEYSNERLRKQFANQGSTLHVSDADLTLGFSPMDYTAPFILNSSAACREVAKSSGQRLLGRVETSKSVTLRMLKDNPESHGLEKKHLAGFSNKPDIVNLQVRIRGKRKRIRAFMGGESILIPCAGKSCRRHKELDYNNVEICSKKALMEKKQFDCEAGNATPGPGWNIDISNGEVVICEPTIHTESETEDLAPQITSIQSLAPHFPQTNLTPLATQLPNPVRRSRPSRASNRFVPQLPTIHVSQSPSRPSILSKAAGQTLQNGLTSVQAMPIILVPPNNNNKRKSNPNAAVDSPAACSFIPISAIPHPVMATQGLTASQLQKSLHNQTQALKTALNIRNPSATLAASALVSKYSNTIVSSSNSETLKIDSVYSTSTPSIATAEPVTPKPREKDLVTITTVVTSNGDDSEATNAQDEKKDKTDNEKPEGTTTNDSVCADAEQEDDDPTAAGSTPTPFNFATNIFEDLDEDHDNEEEESHDFDVPQIVSTSGGVQMPAPETVPIAATYSSPIDEDKTKHFKMKQIRSKIALTKIKEKVEYPRVVTRGDSKFVVCRICNKHIPLNCLKMYRVHLRNKHKVKLAPLLEGAEDQLSATGQAGKVTELPPVESKLPTSVPSSTPIAKEWYKCKACDQLLLDKDLDEHLRSCCSNLTKDVAFERYTFGNETKAAVLVCGLCDKSSETRYGLRQHLLHAHKEVSPKVLMDPDLRCSSCLARFEDSVHCTLHAQLCINRRASPETMLELAQGLLYCEICVRDHESISGTQTCYTNAQMVQCILCLQVLGSRGNFFHHMKNYHFRNTVGIACPFCDLGEIPIRDCFVHILESHYNPILQYNAKLVGPGVAPENRVRTQSDKHVKSFQKKLTDANKTQLGGPVVTTRMVMPALRPAQNPLVTSTLATASPQGQGTVFRTLLPAQSLANPGLRPQIVSLRTLSPFQLGGRATFTTAGINQTQTITIRAGQIVGGSPSGLTTQRGQIPRQVQVGGNHSIIRPIQLNMGSGTLRQLRPISPATQPVTGVGNATFRAIRPMSPGTQTITTTASTLGGPLRQLRPISPTTQTTIAGATVTSIGTLRQIRPGSPAVVTTAGVLGSPTGGAVGVVRTLRPIRPAISIVQQASRGPNSTLGGLPRGGTIQAITPAQLQMRPGQVLQGRVGPTPPGTVRVNFTNSVNLLQK